MSDNLTIMNSFWPAQLGINPGGMGPVMYLTGFAAVFGHKKRIN